jgi:putative flippase GtrA
MNTKKKQKNIDKREFVRIAQYLVSGGAYFWSGYLVFFIADQFLGLNLWWAKLLANITGWTVNYVLQRYWVFNHAHLKKQQVQVTSRYIIITGFNFLLDYLIVYTLQNLGLTPYIGQFVSAGFFTVWNYLWYKYWVFSSKKSKR